MRSLRSLNARACVLIWRPQLKKLHLGPSCVAPQTLPPIHMHPPLSATVTRAWLHAAVTCSSKTLFLGTSPVRPVPKCCIALAGAAARSSVTASLHIRCQVRHLGNPELGFVIALMPSSDLELKCSRSLDCLAVHACHGVISVAHRCLSVALSQCCRCPLPCLPPCCLAG